VLPSSKPDRGTCSAALFSRREIAMWRPACHTTGSAISILAFNVGALRALSLAVAVAHGRILARLGAPYGHGQ